MKVVWVGLQLLVFCLTDLGRPLEMGRMREAKGRGTHDARRLPDWTELGWHEVH
jgi:hypothetical protein